ncbi:MAG TPA: signal recognition particle-docking protein FtsY [Stellaceae bacterium]|nr:signal recognition particle-docking protein FtsY [Stellaceae bacterium]
MNGDRPGFFGRLKAGLTRSAQRLTEGIAAIVIKKKLDQQSLDELEELLIGADLGLGLAQQITEKLKRTRFNQEISNDEIRATLAESIVAALQPCERPLAIDAGPKPFVILVVGVNGSGKTTTIGKLAKLYGDSGKKVVLAAGDTFRAAAVEQLKIWGERARAEVIARPAGADAAGLAFDAVAAAKSNNADIVIIDTAGRLHNKTALMDELEKIIRVLKKAEPSAPHAVLLVLDATVGQNAHAQVQTFRDIIGVTGLVMTKLDGTAKGGVLVALAESYGLPVHFIGVGETAEDLRPFVAADFAKSLVGLEG